MEIQIDHMKAIYKQLEDMQADCAVTRSVRHVRHSWRHVETYSWISV